MEQRKKDTSCWWNERITKIAEDIENITPCEKITPCSEGYERRNS